MFEQRQPAPPLKPELVVHLYNGQYIALTNGNNLAIPAIRPPRDDTLMLEVFESLDINYRSPLGIRITYVDVTVSHRDLQVYTS